jgi:hypothetical protein
MTIPSILLIDDNEQAVKDLAKALAGLLDPKKVAIKTWIPRDEGDPRKIFAAKIESDPRLVVTDYDLTSGGQTGLFGSSIVAWCQQRAIPVGDYSKGKFGQLPKEPDLFEIRIPIDSTAASYIAAVFRGFTSISEALEKDEALLKERSPAAVLARILGVPEMENQFAQYSVRLGAASGSLMAKVSQTAPDDIQPSSPEKRAVLAYITGHLLLGGVLRFPGPILSELGLKAYIASDEANAEDIQGLFSPARYSGPFSELDQFHWLSKVDAILDKIPPDQKTETSGELYRLGLEKVLGRPLKRHGCPRCAGVNGGFLCPFTKRTVCQLPHCSVGSNGWIPQGAKICRIEREFFDEWAPILGL